MGDLVFETGLAAWLGTGLTSVLPARHGTGVDDRVRRRRHRLSDAASNAASADMIVPVAIAVALASDVSPLRPALAATLAPLSAGADRR